MTFVSFSAGPGATVPLVPLNVLAPVTLQESTIAGHFNVTVASLLISDSNGRVTIPNLQGGVTYTVSGQAPPAQTAVNPYKDVSNDFKEILMSPIIVKEGTTIISRGDAKKIITTLPEKKNTINRRTS